jgi:F0F1-type ATP synthase delta subunit
MDQPINLPTQLLTRQDLRRVSRELKALLDILEQITVRSKQGVTSEVPHVSPLLESVAAANKVALDNFQEVSSLAGKVEALGKAAVTFNFSFASSPSAAFLEKLVTWLRTEVTPLAVVQIGLRPSIAAGCILRVNSKIFDLSLGRRLNEQKGKLQEVLFS